MKLSELRKKPHLSASAINDFIDCGLYFKFSRIDKIPIPFKSDSLVFGSAIHKVLEGYYRQKMTGETMTLDMIHSNFENQWEAAAKNGHVIKYSEGKDFDSYLTQGKDLLAVWHENRRDEGYTIFAVEEPFSIYLPDIEIPIIGGIDLVEEDNSQCIIITDHKTPAKSYSTNEVNRNTQLTLYQIAMKNSGYEDRNFILKIDALIKTEKPKFQEFYTARNEKDERKTIHQIQAAWDGIQKGVFVPNFSSWKCEDCPYKAPCDEYLTN